MSTVLETRGLLKRFGGITPTNDVSITVETGARRALIGPNGAGKTTLINLQNTDRTDDEIVAVKRPEQL